MINIDERVKELGHPELSLQNNRVAALMEAVKELQDEVRLLKHINYRLTDA